MVSMLLAEQRLNGSGSEKDIRHFEISLETSGLQYEAGDALGVYPANCPELVEELLLALKCSGDESVRSFEGEPTPSGTRCCVNWTLPASPRPSWRPWPFDPATRN